MDRLFLDANILFSAAYSPRAGLLALWRLRGVQLITSDYALEEARVNLEHPEQRVRLSKLARRTSLVTDVPDRLLPDGVTLTEKDRPILLAAIEAHATHLLTGDLTDSGRYYGRAIEGVLIIPPAEYLRGRRKIRRRGV